MQRIRWRPLHVVVFALVQILTVGNSQMQDAISISEDGWRPIFGTSRRQQPGFDPIIQYKNPSQNAQDIEVIKSENPVSFSSTASPEKPSKSRQPVSEVNNNINTGNALQFQQGEKIPPHTKFTSPGYHTLPALVPHHVPSGAVTISRPSQFGIKKPMIKPTPPPFFGQKRKPLRGPAASHSIRSEVYVQPPNTGFPIIKGPIKIREAQGINILGNSHYSINQPSGHIEFSRFVAPPTNEDIFQQFKSQPVYVFTKPSPADIKKQTDDYTRNLVPPPPVRFLPDKEKKFIKNPIKFEDNIASITETVPKLQEFGIKQQSFRASQIHENLVSQPALQHDKFKVKEQAVDVQVTKEKFKVFHNNIPSIRNPGIVDYVEYDYHSVPAPIQQPKLQTYEVTEGKWIDNPNPYTFSFPPHTQQPFAQKVKQMVTATPQLITEPIVELNVPPFLPTPYKPDTAVPTSATQSEVSTIFSQISAKMNKYKNEQLQTNPLFFNVKEVSTHYPILGKPAFAAEQSINKGETEFTTINPMEDNTQKPKTRRRRPQPRKPTTTTTSTTTEETVTDNQDFQKIINTEMPVEPEKPRKRQRIRPNYFKEREEKPMYTTTVKYENDEFSTEKPIRGKHRFRQRGNYASSNNNDLRTTTRKRLRPKINGVSNNKMSDSDTSLIQHNRFTEPSVETQASHESKYTEEVVQIRQPNMDTDVIKEQSATIINEEPEYQQNYSETEETTEQVHSYEERISTPISKETTLENSLPVNEVDYSTETPTLEQTEEETTTMLTTTTETTSTTKLRTRNKLKYGSSNRPRFSVKEYRQRLNQYSTTTPSTTTDFVKTTSEATRFRFPSRLRTRPTQTTTTQVYQSEEPENTEPVLQRRRFRPKDSRYSSTTSTEVSIIKDSTIKAVNTHLSPFSGDKTTEASSSKISIRPNIFAVRRRPPFTIRQKQNKTEEKTNEQENEVTEAITHDTTTEEEKEVSEVNAEVQVEKIEDDQDEEQERTTAEAERSETTMTDMNDEDYSKRVSDLTSSFKNEYDTPGLFKSVSPNSRRIPNYFTIATDDPILPIEAFFPNIKDKDKE